MTTPSVARSSAPAATPKAAKAKTTAEIAKATKIFEAADLADLTGHGVVKILGDVKYRAKDANIVVATGRASYDDLWGGKGKGTFEITINVKTGKAKGTLE